MDRSGWIDNSAAVPALARWVEWMMGRSMVVVVDTWMCVCVYVYARTQGRRDAVPRPTNIAGSGWCMEMVRDGQRDGGGGAG